MVQTCRAPGTHRLRPVGYDGRVTLRLAVLGDSIAAGQGASRREDTLAERLRRGLAEAGVDASTQVFAVSGARSRDLRGQVTRAIAWEPDLAVVVIGANDVTHRTPPQQAAQELAETVRRLRGAGAEVVVAPAPDLSAVPHVPPAMRAAVRAASHGLRRRQIEAAAAEGARIADADATTSGAFDADATLFSADRFHPSSAGYAVIAGQLLPHVLDAAGAVNG
jgi:lysophospholipase L1-like esterase